MRALLLRKGKKEVDRREGREEEGICRTNVKVLPTPLLQLYVVLLLLPDLRYGFLNSEALHRPERVSLLTKLPFKCRHPS